MNTVKLRVIKKVCLMERKKTLIKPGKILRYPAENIHFKYESIFTSTVTLHRFLSVWLSVFLFFNHFRRILEERTGIFKQIDIFIYIRKTELTHIYLRKNFGFFCKMFL